MKSVVACIFTVGVALAQQEFPATVVVKPTMGAKRGRKTSPDVANLGSEKCTWGPSYWCESADNAAECGFNYKECPDGDSDSWTLDDCKTGAPFFCASEAKADYCNYDYSKCSTYFTVEGTTIPQASGTVTGTVRYSTYPVSSAGTTTRYSTGYPVSSAGTTTRYTTGYPVSSTITSYPTVSSSISTATGYPTTTSTSTLTGYPTSSMRPVTTVGSTVVTGATIYPSVGRTTYPSTTLGAATLGGSRYVVG